MKKEGRNDEYFNIPKKLILEEGYKRLSSDAKLVLAYMMTENENASLEEIGEFLGMDIGGVEEALDEVKNV